MELNDLKKAQEILSEIEGLKYFRSKIMHTMKCKPFSFQITLGFFEGVWTNTDETHMSPYDCVVATDLQDSILSCIDNKISELEQQIIKL